MSLALLAHVSTAAALTVGYYEMCSEKGEPWQVPPITTAGQTPVLLDDLTAADLAGVNVIFVTNCDNDGYSAEYTSRLTDIENAVSGGAVLVLHDRHVADAETILPGGATFTVTRDLSNDADIDVLNGATVLTNGPGGVIDDTTLDGGCSSSHGFAVAGTLPGGASLLLSRSDPSQIVTFSYSYGAGEVVYSSIPLDYYLAGGSCQLNMAPVYAPNVVAYAVAISTCGDGTVDAGEQCDDGDFENGDGCSASCTIETCWSCSGTPSACAPLGSGASCPDDGEVCTSDVCDGAGVCTHPGDVALGTPCPDDGEVCTSDVCDGAGACTHPGDVALGTPCPDDGSLCTADQCDGAGSCTHPTAVDCDVLNQCYPTGTFTCDPQSGTCQACPAGYVAGGGGCQKTYAIDDSLLDNLGDACSPTERYNSCSGPFGFHWADTGDAAVGAVIGVDVRLEAGVSCSGTSRAVALNGAPIGTYAPAGVCSCGSSHAPRLVSAGDVSSYVKGGANAVLTDDPGNCEGLSDDGTGAFAIVTVTYAAPPAVPLPDGTGCDDGTFCNGADTCETGACAVHAGDPCPGPDGDANCAESCDEAADACTGVDAAGTLCRAGNGVCDVAETCDGTNPSCPADAKQADGTTCDDGSACTQTDACQAGVCTGADPVDCSDGDPCTVDSCNAVGGCLNEEAPASGCLGAGRSIVLIKSNAGDHTKDKLLWKWIKGGAVDQTDLADPTAATGYALCVYAGSASSLIASAALPPGSGWSAVGRKGYKFKGSSPDGLSLALMKGGTAGKSKALAKGKGASLPDPSLPVDYPLTVQLRRDDAALCLESTFTAADELRNDGTQYKAKR